MINGSDMLNVRKSIFDIADYQGYTRVSGA